LPWPPWVTRHLRSSTLFELSGVVEGTTEEVKIFHEIK
jgi:hypothetical protein